MVARRLACLLLGLDPAQVAILPDDRGVPWLEHDDRGRLHFSLSVSHTTGVAAAALARLPILVGIDVERPIASPFSIIRDYFTESEASQCAAPNTEEVRWRAAEIWALKEAGLKALGTGLAAPTSSVVVCSVGADPTSSGWNGTELGLGESVGNPGWEIVGWVRRTLLVVVAVAAVVRDFGNVSPEPEEPRLFIVDGAAV